MKARMVIAVLLLLSLAGSVAAQGIDAKTIPQKIFLFEGQTGCHDDRFWSGIAWQSPEKMPHDYRISWKVDGEWPNKKRDKRGDRGNVFVKPSDTGLVVQGFSQSYFLPTMKLACGDMLHVRIRARYKGEKNGPWVQVVIVRYS